MQAVLSAGEQVERGRSRDSEGNEGKGALPRGAAFLWRCWQDPAGSW